MIITHTKLALFHLLLFCLGLALLYVYVASIPAAQLEFAEKTVLSDGNGFIEGTVIRHLVGESTHYLRVLSECEFDAFVSKDILTADINIESRNVTLSGSVFEGKLTATEIVVHAE